MIISLKFLFLINAFNAKNNAEVPLLQTEAYLDFTYCEIFSRIL